MSPDVRGARERKGRGSRDRVGRTSIPDGAPSSAGKRTGPDLHISIQARGAGQAASSRPDTRPHLITCPTDPEIPLASMGASTHDGMFTARVFWRQDSVLKSGTVQSRPISRSRLSTNPPRHDHSDQWRSHGSIWRNAMPNSTFMIRHVSMAFVGKTVPRTVF